MHLSDEAVGLLDVEPAEAIASAEYRERQRALGRAAAALGFDGALVWSRGGAPVDMCADVLYLTNHYSQMPAAADDAPMGRARAHAACFVEPDGHTDLVVDIPWWREDLVSADHVTVTVDVPAEAARIVRDRAPAGARIGLVGVSNMTGSALDALRAQLPDHSLVSADRLVHDLRLRKSEAEVALIRAACEIGNVAMERLMDGVVPGNTERAAAAGAIHAVAARGGVVYDLACASGAHSHYYGYARMPSVDPVHRLGEGEILHVDFFGTYGGYLFDFARTRVAGDQPTREQRMLMDAAIGGVMTLCKSVRPGMTGGEMHALAIEWLTGQPLPAGIELPALVGHGLGLGWEAPWLMEGCDDVVEEGTYLAVELMLGHPSSGGAMFEHNGLVRRDGLEILTTATPQWH
jgi:Xaa-Pro aminopeptidase